MKLEQVIAKMKKAAGTNADIQIVSEQNAKFVEIQTKDGDFMVVSEKEIQNFNKLKQLA